MVRVAISVEGVTEERFVNKCLIPHFLPMGIHVTPISLDGNVSVDRIGGEINKLLRSFDFVTTLYDFYGFKKKNEGETKESLETRIRESLPENRREKLIPYIQMYEFEGLLFSSPAAIASVLQDDDLETWATNVLSNFQDNPERVNNSSQTAPKKRLEAIHDRYRESTHSPLIACEIGVDGMRGKCSGFDAWITSLEALA